MIHCVFIYGINIPGCPWFTHEGMRKNLNRLAKDDFRLLAIGRRPDTLLIQSTSEYSPSEAAKWVEKRIGRPTIGRDANVLQSLYHHACSLAQQFTDGFDSEKWAVKLEDRLWKLGAVFASHELSGDVTLHSTSTVKVLGRFRLDTVIVLKKEQTDSGKRITWGERANVVVRKPWELALKRSVVCSSRSITVINTMLGLLPDSECCERVI